MSEYEEYLDELEAERQAAIAANCKQGHHTESHFYGFARCTTCGESRTTQLPGRDE